MHTILHDSIRIHVNNEQEGFTEKGVEMTYFSDYNPEKDVKIVTITIRIPLEFYRYLFKWWVKMHRMKKKVRGIRFWDYAHLYADLSECDVMRNTRGRELK